MPTSARCDPFAVDNNAQDHTGEEDRDGVARRHGWCEHRLQCSLLQGEPDHGRDHEDVDRPVGEEREGSVALLIDEGLGDGGLEPVA